jgi:hypothetical protein
MAEDTKTDEQRRAEAQAKADAAKARVDASRQAAAPKAEQSNADHKPLTGEGQRKRLSVAENADARSAAYATNRWATIKDVDETFDHDPRREVINISLMENGPPEVSADLADERNEEKDRYSYQQVGPGVMIGMREGGEFEGVDGFGWKDADDKAAHGNPNGAGATRMAQPRRR